MAKKNKNTLFLNPWSIGIGSSVFGVLTIRLIDKLTGSKILETVFNILKFILNNTTLFFNQEFHWKLYSLIALFLSGPLVGILIIWVISKIQDSNIAPTPKWLEYIKDNFNGVIYKWEYEKGYNGKYEITNLTPYCTNCECQLVYENCPNCQSHFGYKIKQNYELTPLIIHRIDMSKKETNT